MKRNEIIGEMQQPGKIKQITGNEVEIENPDGTKLTAPAARLIKDPTSGQLKLGKPTAIPGQPNQTNDPAEKQKMPKPGDQVNLATEGAEIDWRSDDVETVKAMGQEFYIKDTPEGKLLLGDDIEGYFYADHNGQEREGHITFVYNLDTGKFIEFPDDYSQFYGYLDDDEVSDYVKELVDEIESKMDSNKESVSLELEELDRVAKLAGIR